MAKDVVCDMEVVEKNYYIDYKGVRYYFCSQLCKDEFNRNPSNYVGSEGKKGRDRLLKSVEIVDNDPPKVL